MYILELLVKFLQKDKVEDLIEKYENDRAIDPLNNKFEDIEESSDSEDCEHIFMPIDSTRETFACSKCGLVISKKAYEKRNFFKDK